MTISSDYGTMQRQIADELGDNQALLSPLSDSSLTLSPIQNAIQQAIAKWEREKFYFNQLLIQTPLAGPYPWQTSIGQEYYGDDTTPQAWTGPDFSTVAYIEKMWVLVTGQRYEINMRTSQYLIGVSVNPAVTSYPIDCAIEAELARLYPIPSGTYPIGILGTKRFAPLINSTDANAWTQDGYDLIRTEAKLQLARDVISDAETYSACIRALYGDPEVPGDRGFVYALKGETTRRVGRGKIIPSFF